MPDNGDKLVEGVYIDSAWRTDFDSQAEILYELILKNRTSKPYSFNKALVRWQYHGGSLTSIGLGDILTPRTTYVVDLPLDVDSWYEITGPIDYEVSLQPQVVVPSGTPAMPGSVTFQLQLHYSFVGRVDWHPCYDWDISFSVLLLGESDGIAEVIPLSSWRNPDALK